MSNQNKYGLILRDKSKPQLTFQASRNVFGNESDSDDEKARKPVLWHPSENMNKQIKISQQRAIKDDPTVYQYDEIYDSMSKEKETKKEMKEEKKPKYIENLMKTANKRKLESDRRFERQVQKEREKEGEEFVDKEVFVTSAYKKKLEEMRLEEEKEKHEDYLESIADVTKQSDLGGFYRHLYEQKLGSDKSPKVKERTPTKEETPTKAETPEIEQKNINDDIVSKKLKQIRNYRKRKISSEMKLSEGEIEDSEDEIKFSNLADIKTFKKSKLSKENIDADTDFSIDDEVHETKKDVPSVSIKSETVTSETRIKTAELPNITEKEKPKVKIDIWKKRTVGEAFEQALKRYYERKASRSG